MLDSQGILQLSRPNGDGRRRDVARIGAQRPEEEVRAGCEREEHDHEGPLETRAPASEDVIGNGAEEKRSEGLRHGSQEGPHAFGAAPEERGDYVEPGCVQGWVLRGEGENRE